jgi:hypothetical protein
MAVCCYANAYPWKKTVLEDAGKFRKTWSEVQRLVSNTVR